MVYRRFLALTGKASRIIFSDDGINFVGAHAEMKHGLACINKKWMTSAMY